MGISLGHSGLGVVFLFVLLSSIVCVCCGVVLMVVPLAGFSN